jgi:hypothetical protein
MLATKDEALKMAIKFINNTYSLRPDVEATLNACKEALEQPAQEPVSKVESKCKCDFRTKLVGDGCRYCQPQDFIDRLLDDLKDCDERIDELEMKEWQGLTDEEIDNIKTKTIIGAKGMSVEQLLLFIVSLTEQELKEKNT